MPSFYDDFRGEDEEESGFGVDTGSLVASIERSTRGVSGLATENTLQSVLRSLTSVSTYFGRALEVQELHFAQYLDEMAEDGSEEDARETYRLAFLDKWFTRNYDWNQANALRQSRESELRDKSLLGSLDGITRSVGELAVADALRHAGKTPSGMIQEAYDSMVDMRTTLGLSQEQWLAMNQQQLQITRDLNDIYGDIFSKTDSDVAALKLFNNNIRGEGIMDLLPTMMKVSKTYGEIDDSNLEWMRHFYDTYGARVVEDIISSAGHISQNFGGSVDDILSPLNNSALSEDMLANAKLRGWSEKQILEATQSMMQATGMFTASGTAGSFMKDLMESIAKSSSYVNLASNPAELEKMNALGLDYFSLKNQLNSGDYADVAETILRSAMDAYSDETKFNTLVNMGWSEEELKSLYVHGDDILGKSQDIESSMLDAVNNIDKRLSEYPMGALERFFNDLSTKDWFNNIVNVLGALNISVADIFFVLAMMKSGAHLVGALKGLFFGGGTGATAKAGLLSGLFGKGASAGGAAAAGGSAGAMSVLGPALGITGGIVGGVSLIDGLVDMASASVQATWQEQEDKLAEGAIQAGTTAAGAGIGAAIGTAILPGVGSLIGAGIGAGATGLIGLIFGDDAASYLTDMLDGTANIKKVAEQTKSATEGLVKAWGNQRNADELIEKYRELDAQLEENNISTADRQDLENQQKEILNDLNELYPGVVGGVNDDKEALDKQLVAISKVAEAEMNLARLRANQVLKEVPGQAEDLTNQLHRSQERQEELELEVEDFNRASQIVEQLKDFSKENPNWTNMLYYDSFLGQHRILDDETIDALLESPSYAGDAERLRELKGNTGPLLEALNLSKELESLYRSNNWGNIGDLLDKDGGYNTLMNGMQLIPEKFDNGEVADSIETALNNYTQAMQDTQSKQEALDAAYIDTISLLEASMGTTIDTAIADWDKLLEPQKRAVEDAVQKMQELDTSFGEVSSAVRPLKDSINLLAKRMDPNTSIQAKYVYWQMAQGVSAQQAQRSYAMARHYGATDADILATMPEGYRREGLSKVPNDGYSAILHQNEMVLPDGPATVLRAIMQNIPGMSTFTNLEAGLSAVYSAMKGNGEPNSAISPQELEAQLRREEYARNLREALGYRDAWQDAWTPSDDVIGNFRKYYEQVADLVGYAMVAPEAQSTSSAGYISNATRAKIVSAAESAIGKKYIWGGEMYDTNYEGADCSGLVYFAYNEAGLGKAIGGRLGSNSYYKRGKNITKDQLLPGDVVYSNFGGLSSPPDLPGHIGIYAYGDKTIEAGSKSTGIHWGNLSKWKAFQRLVDMDDSTDGMISPVSYSTGTTGGTEGAIFNALLAKIGNPYGVAGIMGNLRAESGFIPTNMENQFEKKLGFTDATYTAAVDNGSYANFGDDRVGYGLAQWTYPSRKKNMYSFMKGKGLSIGDASGQIDFLEKEARAMGLWDAMKTVSSIQEASDKWLLDFERPGGAFSSTSPKRAGYSKEVYDKYLAGTYGTAAFTAVDTSLSGAMNQAKASEVKITTSNEEMIRELRKTTMALTSKLEEVSGYSRTLRTRAPASVNPSSYG